MTELARGLPGYAELLAVLRLVHRVTTKPLPVAPEILHRVMTVYAKSDVPFGLEHLAHWDALGLDLTRYPKLMETAYGHEDKELVMRLMARGIPMCRWGRPKFGWVECILVLLGARSKSKRVPVKRIPTELIRVLATFLDCSASEEKDGWEEGNWEGGWEPGQPQAY